MDPMRSRKYPERTAAEYLQEEDDLLNIPEPRLPVVLCLDRSVHLGMSGLRYLQEGLDWMTAKLKRSPTACRSVELCVISCAGEEPWMEVDFQRPGNMEPPRLLASTRCPLGEALRMGVRSLQRQLLRYEQTGQSFFPPWFVVLSHGEWGLEVPMLPTGLEELRMLARSRAMHLEVHAVGPRESVRPYIQELTDSGFAPLWLPENQVPLFFRWLTVCILGICHSHVWENIPLPSHPEWGECVQWQPEEEDSRKEPEPPGRNADESFGLEYPEWEKNVW